MSDEEFAMELMNPENMIGDSGPGSTFGPSVQIVRGDISTLDVAETIDRCKVENSKYYWKCFTMGTGLGHSIKPKKGYEKSGSCFQLTSEVTETLKRASDTFTAMF